MPPRRRPEGAPPRPEPAVHQPPNEMELPDHITVRDMAELMERSPIDIIKVLMNYGIMAPITQSIDFDMASVVAEEMGVKVKKLAKPEPKPLDDETTSEQGKSKTLRQRLLEVTPEERLAIRPPVVTVLGHVDHGKTTLLDAIRKTNVVASKFGWDHPAHRRLSGRIRWSQDHLPGHTWTRGVHGHAGRGAQATDIAVLVVAADDGVMPQTREAIAHARAAGVPIIVALNKIDKANANPDQVKQQLSHEGLLVEEWGGDVICVPVAAKMRRGIDELLENVLLLADVEGFKADPEGPAVGTVIESNLDKARGSTATLLVQKGTLHVADAVAVGTVSGRIRAMYDGLGRPVEAATPSTPVIVLGLSEVPTAGDTFQVVKDERAAREIASARAELQRVRYEAATAPKAVTLDDVFALMKAGKTKELRLILKADVDGSLEPIINSLNHLSSEELKIKLLHTGTGDITDSDLMLAAASGAIIIGFHVDLSVPAQKSDLVYQVDVRTYKVIYELIADIDKALKGLLEPVFVEKTLGKAEVRAIFRVPKRGKIAGCFVTEGEITRSAASRLKRAGVDLFTGRIGSLKRFQEDVNEVRTGFECGIALDSFEDVREGDIIEAFQKVR